MFTEMRWERCERLRGYCSHGGSLRVHCCPCDHQSCLTCLRSQNSIGLVRRGVRSVPDGSGQSVCFLHVSFAMTTSERRSWSSVAEPCCEPSGSPDRPPLHSAWHAGRARAPGRLSPPKNAASKQLSARKREPRTATASWPKIGVLPRMLSW